MGERYIRGRQKSGGHFNSKYAFGRHHSVERGGYRGERESDGFCEFAQRKLSEIGFGQVLRFAHSVGKIIEMRGSPLFAVENEKI